MSYVGHVTETLPGGAAVPQWTLGDRMRKARLYAGLEQAQLAAEIGIGRGSVVNYEADRTRPSRPVLLSWALRCGVPLAWLTGTPAVKPQAGGGSKSAPTSTTILTAAAAA